MAVPFHKKTKKKKKFTYNLKRKVIEKTVSLDARKMVQLAYLNSTLSEFFPKLK